MKKYVILAHSIGRVGGGQIYCRNKIKYCIEKGYMCYLFPAEPCKKVFIDDLKEYSENICPEFLYPPQLFPKMQIKKRIKWISQKINFQPDDEIIIESHTVKNSLWGELFAEKWNCKHFIFLLTEDVGNLSHIEESFLLFKWKRAELACIKKEVMELLFKDILDFTYEKAYELSAMCVNSVENIPIPKQFNGIGKNTIVIGIVGRVRKPYILSGIKEIIIFTHKHPYKKFEIVLIGGSIEDADALNLLVNQENNVSLIITDYMYPIPQKLLKKMKVCIAGSGSAYAVYELVPTISIDVYSGNAIGVLGYDTESTLIKDNVNEIKINEYLEDIIFGDFLTRKSPFTNKFFSASLDDINYAYNKHFDFIKQSEQAKQYYNFSNTHDLQLSISKFIYTIGGIKFLDFCRKTKSKMKKLR